MLKIDRTAERNALSEHSRNVLRDETESTLPVGDRWKNLSAPVDRDIRQALNRDSNFHCVYCDTLISNQTVEHRAPQNEFPALAFTWANFENCCSGCNQGKNGLREDALSFLDPYAHDIENSLGIDAERGTIHGIPCSPCGDLIDEAARRLRLNPSREKARHFYVHRQRAISVLRQHLREISDALVAQDSTALTRARMNTVAHIRTSNYRGSLLAYFKFPATLDDQQAVQRAARVGLTVGAVRYLVRQVPVIPAWKQDLVT